LIDLWKSFTEQLKVELGVNIEEVSDKDSVVEVTFTVTNEASPPAADHPEILFEKLVLTLDTPRDSHDIELGSLSPQDSVTHTVEMPYSDLIDMKYELAGTVSPTAFLRVRKTGAHGGKVSMTVDTYLQLLDELSIHRWLDAVIKSFPVPGPETTLGELSDLAGPLRDAISEIRDTECRLQRLAELATRGRQREIVSTHRGLVEQYLTETIQGVAKIDQTLRSSNPMEVSRTVATVTKRLDREAAKVTEATKKLSGGLD